MSEDDHGNILLLEHINLNTQTPEAALAFFLKGLGLTQDARMGEVVDGRVFVNTTIWLNAGLSQFHMPITSRGASGPRNNVLRGTIYVDVPSLEDLRVRLAGLRDVTHLHGTSFAFKNGHADGEAHLVITDPAGNHFIARERPGSARDIRCYHPGPLSWCLGIPVVEITCPHGTTDGIANYYTHYFGAAASAADGRATVRTGPSQNLRFVERDDLAIDTSMPYHERGDGLHICIYLADHAGPLSRLHADGLLWGNPRYRDLDRGLGTQQFRCKDIVDPRAPAGSRLVLLELEHEVRTTTHSTSPFGHVRPYKLLDRSDTVAALVSEVTPAFEKEFEAVRAAKMAVPEGWVPDPPRPGPGAHLTLFTWSTPNGVKVSVCLEELGIPYDVATVHIGEGEQHLPGYVKVSPSHKIPALVDPNVRDARTGAPLTVFESCAILVHLATHYGGGRLLGGPTIQERTAALEWLFFQAASFGPNTGQLHHFLSAAGVNGPPVTQGALANSVTDGGVQYSVERFNKEVRRLYGVINDRLAAYTYLAGDHFSIADIAVLGWVWRHPKHKVNIAADFPHVKRWWDRVTVRESVQRGLAVPTDEQKARPRTGQLSALARAVLESSAQTG